MTILTEYARACSAGKCHPLRRWGRTGGQWLLLLLLVVQGACAHVPSSGSPGPATGLALQLDSILADTTLTHAHIGAVVVSLTRGDTLYSREAGRVFLPASNQKLLTGAAALETLGPGYQFATTISASGDLRDGVLRGDLIVRGSGDPTFSARFAEDSRTIFHSWADSLRARGITQVQGGIVGVDSVFPRPGLGAGWAWDDLVSGYSAEVAGLQFNEGVAQLQIVPGSSVGSPAVVMLDPPLQHVRIYNLTTTGFAGSPLDLRIQRDDAGPGITVEGNIPEDTAYLARTIAVRNPTAYFLSAMRETLREAGIVVEGQALPAEDWPIDRTGVVEMQLFTHRSPPLGEILEGMMKPSQNQIAEALLLTVGRELRDDATAQGGAMVVDSLLRAWHLPADELRMADGSGLSRYNLVSPRLLTGLLVHMDRSASRDAWLASLPRAGVDGTLRDRMQEPPLEGQVIAKTGTLSGVRSLSGYLTTTTGERVAFSFMVDNHLRSVAEVDRVVEAALHAVAVGR